MDVAGTFFANLTTILIALQDKSVPFHFANNLDLYELDFFECSSVHLPPQKSSQFFCRFIYWDRQISGLFFLKIRIRKNSLSSLFHKI